MTHKTTPLLYNFDKNDKFNDLEPSLENQVTIFIPTYKNDHLLLSCVKSCIEQSYSNINIFVVDNGFKEFGDSLKNKLTLLNDQRLHYHANISNIELQGNFHLILSLAENTSLFMVIPADFVLAKNAIELMVKAYLSNSNVSLVYGRTLVRDISNYKLTTDINDGGTLNPWPYDLSSIYDTSKVINYFFNKININSDLSHFSFIGTLMSGTFIKSLALKRVPMFYHGWEEYISLIVLSYSKDIAILNEPLFILYTNNERFGWAARPNLNYTRYEPILTEFKYLNEFESLLIKRDLSPFKLNLFLLIKTFYTIFRYPGVTFYLIPIFFNVLIRTILIYLPIEIYMSFKKLKSN